ncbi:hypothetical protein RI367_002213 [Sorochytrium milnesiophthora]
MFRSLAQYQTETRPESRSQQQQQQQQHKHHPTCLIDSDASSDDDGDDDVSDYGAPVTAGQQIDARAHSDFKMVFIIRTDLGMTKGKVAAQMLKAWERIGQAKVTLKCDSEDEMNELQAIAASLSLPARSIRDAGRTQIAAGSRTVLAIGPGPVSIVNQVTGHLKLY